MKTLILSLLLLFTVGCTSVQTVTYMSPNGTQQNIVIMREPEAVGQSVTTVEVDGKVYVFAQQGYFLSLFQPAAIAAGVAAGGAFVGKGISEADLTIDVGR